MYIYVENIYIITFSYVYTYVCVCLSLYVCTPENGIRPHSFIVIDGCEPPSHTLGVRNRTQDFWKSSQHA